MFHLRNSKRRPEWQTEIHKETGGFETIQKGTTQIKATRQIRRATLNEREERFLGKTLLKCT